MLVKNKIHLSKTSYFSLSFRWLFLNYNFFMFLTVFRILGTNLQALKTTCYKYNISSRFFVGHKLNTVFNSKYNFFASTGIVLYSKELNFNFKFFQELSTVFPGFIISNFIFKTSFLNLYSLSVEDFFRVINTSNVELPLFYYSYLFFFSNLLVLCSHFVAGSKQVEDDEIYKKLINK